MAAYAHRTIRIVDGLVDDDEAKAVVPHSLASAQEDQAERTMCQPGRKIDGGDSVGNSAFGLFSSNKRPLTTPRPRRRHQAPKIDDDASAKPGLGLAPSLLPATWRTALGALRRNKMRAGLSALGVIIAVAAVIAMTEIGQGSKATLQKSIASMGANTIMIFAGSTNNSGVNKGAGSAVTLTPQDAKEIARQCPAVKSVATIVRARSQIVYGNRNCVPENIYGTTPSYLEVRDWKKMTAGEMFSDRDVRNSNKVCVIGNTIKQNLFPKMSPIGKEIRINNVAFRVIGVLSRKGANMVGMDQDNIVLAPGPPSNIASAEPRLPTRTRAAAPAAVRLPPAIRSTR